MAEYSSYMNWDKEQFGDPTLRPRAWGLPDLDACGTIGVSMVETYEITGNPRLLPVIRDIGEAVTQHIPRFEDGTFHRVHTMWADDLYMSCPFLARLARLTGEASYADEVYRQVKGFYKRLWIEEEKIFSHIYFVEEKAMSRVPWGRGNGWIAVTLTEILALLAADDPRWQEALHLFQHFMQGIAPLQDACGMWHQVLNPPPPGRRTTGIKNGAFSPKGENPVFYARLPQEGRLTQAPERISPRFRRPICPRPGCPCCPCRRWWCGRTHWRCPRFHPPDTGRGWDRLRR